MRARVCLSVNVCVCLYGCECLCTYARGVTCKLKTLRHGLGGGGGGGGSYICASVHAEHKFPLKRMAAFSSAVDACVS